MEHLRHDDLNPGDLELFDDPLFLFDGEILGQGEKVPAGIVGGTLEVMQHHDRLGRRPHGQHRTHRSTRELLEGTVSGAEFLRSHRGQGRRSRIVLVDCLELRVLR
jgi:hypothetical protein